MKCVEVHHWLVAARPDAELPCGLRQHLLSCLDCRLQQQALARLDQQVRGLQLPQSNNSVRDQLWQRIDAQAALARASLPPLPQLPLESRSAQRGRKRWLRQRWHLAVAAAAVVVFALGLLLGRQSTPIPPDQKLPAAHRPAGTAELVVQTARHDVQLASAGTDRQRLDVLRQLTLDLKEEVLRHTRQGTLEDVPLLVELYKLAATHGVVRRTLLLSANERPGAAAAVVQEFQSSAAEIQSFAKSALPVVADMLEPLTSAALQSSTTLQNAEASIPPALDAPSRAASDNPLAALVHLSVKLADAAEPLERANLSAEVATVLAQATVVLSAAGAVDHADQLGNCLGDVLERGVAGNLAMVPVQGDKNVQAEVARIWASSAQAIVVLEDNLAFASPLAKEGLQKALSSSHRGRDAVQKQSKAESTSNTGPTADATPVNSGSGKGKPTLSPGLAKDPLKNHPGKGKDAHETVKGTVTSVDIGLRTITLAVKKKGKLDNQTFTLHKFAKVTTEPAGLPGTLNAGAEVQLHFSEDDHLVIEIRVLAKKGKSDSSK